MTNGDKWHVSIGGHGENMVDCHVYLFKNNIQVSVTLEARIEIAKYCHGVLIKEVGRKNYGLIRQLFDLPEIILYKYDSVYKDMYSNVENIKLYFDQRERYMTLILMEIRLQDFINYTSVEL